MFAFKAARGFALQTARRPVASLRPPRPLQTLRPDATFRQALSFQPRRPIFNGPRYTRFDGRGGQQQQQQWSNFGPVYRAQYIWRNYQRPLIAVGVAGGVVYVYNLEEVPITRRRRFNILSPETEKEVFGGPEAYNQLLAQFRSSILPADHPLTIQVADVVERLLPTTGGLAGDDWRVHVIDDKSMMNAFVIPGGKVFVFTGLLPVCQTEAGLATVLGHEIAHNVAHHMSERISRSSITFLASIVLALLFQVDSRYSSNIVDLALSLPNSRTQESEADHIGLLMMAEACYDPQEAVAFWGRMQKAEEMQPPEFLSTHPSSYNRVDHIKKLLPQAMDIYNDKGCGATGSLAADKRSLIESMMARLPPATRGRPSRPGQSDDDDFF